MKMNHVVACCPDGKCGCMCHFEPEDAPFPGPRGGGFIPTATVADIESLRSQIGELVELVDKLTQRVDVLDKHRHHHGDRISPVNYPD